MLHSVCTVVCSDPLNVTAVLADVSTVDLTHLAPSTTYALRFVLGNAAGTTNGSVSLVQTLDVQSASTALAFNGDFVQVFGAVPAAADLAAFAAALNATLGLQSVQTHGIASFAVLPGSIVVEVVATAAAIRAINALAAVGSIVVPFRGHQYYLVGFGPTSTASTTRHATQQQQGLRSALAMRLTGAQARRARRVAT